MIAVKIKTKIFFKYFRLIIKTLPVAAIKNIIAVYLLSIIDPVNTPARIQSLTLSIFIARSRKYTDISEKVRRKVSGDINEEYIVTKGIERNVKTVM